MAQTAFAWARTIASCAKVKVRGLARVRHHFTLAITAYNLIRMPRLVTEAAQRSADRENAASVSDVASGRRVVRWRESEVRRRSPCPHSHSQRQPVRALHADAMSPRLQICVRDRY